MLVILNIGIHGLADDLGALDAILLLPLFVLDFDGLVFLLLLGGNRGVRC